MSTKEVEIIKLPSIDEVFDKMRQVDKRTTRTNTSCAVLLDISKSSITHSRTRNTLPLAAIVHYCKQNKYSLDWMLDNKVDKTEHKTIGIQESTASYSTAVITEEMMKEAMMLISAEIARAKAPWNDNVISMLIKTYFKFKDRTDSNITMIIRAVAESQAE